MFLLKKLEPERGVQTEEERESCFVRFTRAPIPKGLGISNIEQGMLNVEGTEFYNRYSLFDILRFPT